MKTRSLFSVYSMLGMIAAIATQALPIVYTSYNLTDNQVYNLISIVFLATAFQPLLGFIIDKFFTQERGISLLFAIVGILALGLTLITEYKLLLVLIFIFSIFRVPLFAICDGYAAGQVHKFRLNMGLIRGGSTVGYGLAMAILIGFLTIFGLSANYSFLFIAILSFITVIIIEISSSSSKGEEPEVEERVDESGDDQTSTKWGLLILLLWMQITFFGFSILKINYTTPFLVEHGYSNGLIAATTIIGMIPIFILMPLFGQLFSKFKYTTLILIGIFTSLVQTILFLLFPSSLVIVLFGSFLTGFIFPIYTPVFGLFLRKAVNYKYISTGFTTIFTAQNLFVFFFNQFVVIAILNNTKTINTAYLICLLFFLVSLIPVAILRYKSY